LLERNLGPCHALLVRKAAVDSVGSFVESKALHGCEDWDLWLRIASTGAKFIPVNGEFACYRQYSNSMSKDNRRMLETGLAVIEKNLQLHKSCRVCKAAATRGRQRWCAYCWTRLCFEPRVVLTGEIFGYLPLLLRIARKDLGVIFWMLAIFFWKGVGLRALGRMKS
jgi:hypothetical protein